MRFSLDQDKPVDVFFIRRCFRRDEPFRGLIRGKKQYFPQFTFVVKKKTFGAWFERVVVCVEN